MDVAIKKETRKILVVTEDSLSCIQGIYEHTHVKMVSFLFISSNCV